MIGWRSRVVAGVVLFLTIHAHRLSTADLPNSPAGMLVFHGSAALVDLLLIYAAPVLLSGRLCDDMQTLCLMSVVVNFVGWLAYLAYAPPIFYNVISWSLAYVQWGRLFFVDGDDADYLGLHLVRGRHHGWSQFHS